MSETQEIILPCEPSELIWIDGSEVKSITEHDGFGGKYWTILLIGDCGLHVDQFGEWVRKPHPQLVIRKPKPKTAVKPWDFVTMPEPVMRVRDKESGEMFVAHARPGMVAIYDHKGIAAFSFYEEFSERYEQLDGTPCGLVEVTP